MRLICLFVLLGLIAQPATSNSAEPLTVVVMDPLAAPLSCPCVEGYAQRDYEKLAEYLKTALGREVKVTFANALSIALKATEGRADVIIGKDSVVRADAQAAKIDLHPLAQLTDKSGSTMQHGLIVVNKADPAREAKDLSGYTIIFGPSEAAEKHSAAMDLLRTAQVAIPKTLHIDEACSDGACKVIDLGPTSKTAAVISSYAQPLLEGCGTIKKGDLRVVGKTKDVPFVSAFVNASLPAKLQKEIKASLLGVGTNIQLLDALETLVGFVEYDESSTSQQVSQAAKKTNSGYLARLAGARTNWSRCRVA